MHRNVFLASRWTLTSEFLCVMADLFISIWTDGTNSSTRIRFRKTDPVDWELRSLDWRGHQLQGAWVSYELNKRVQLHCFIHRFTRSFARQQATKFTHLLNKTEQVLLLSFYFVFSLCNRVLPDLMILEVAQIFGDSKRFRIIQSFLIPLLVK